MAGRARKLPGTNWKTHRDQHFPLAYHGEVTQMCWANSENRKEAAAILRLRAGLWQLLSFGRRMLEVVFALTARRGTAFTRFATRLREGVS